MFHYFEGRRAYGILLLALVPLLCWLPIIALGEEEEPQACTPPGTPPQFTPTTHPVAGTELVITEGQLSATGTDTVSDYHGHATMAMDSAEELLVAWEGSVASPDCGKSAIYAVHLNNDGTSACPPHFLSPPVGTTSNIDVEAFKPSSVMTAEGLAHIGWTAKIIANFDQSSPFRTGTLLSLSDLCSLGTPGAPSSTVVGFQEYEVSVGVSSGAAVAAWSRGRDPAGDPVPGLLHKVTTDEHQIANCVPSCNQFCPGEDICWLNRWQPAAAMRSDGKYLIAYCEFELQDASNNFMFDIKLQGFDANGNMVGDELTINTSVSVDPTIEESPAIAIDSADQDGKSNVVVAWTGRQPDGCTARSRIFARRLTWDGTGTPVVQRDQFMADSDSTLKPVSGTEANPAVALTSDPNHRGRWVAAWNVVNSAGTQVDVHAQYFEADGRPMGGEFRVNWEQDSDSRGLGNSAQHTVAYHETVAFAWHRGNFSGGAISPLDVHFTLLPAGYADYQESVSPGCLKGDVNFDESVDIDDIAPFVAVLLDGPPLGACSNIIDLCPYDMNNDAAVNGLDVDCFTKTVLGPPGCSPTTLRILDCNGNSVPDSEDIENETSADVNSNGIPDECEVDCNTNGVPDDWDIAQATSGDCDTNGVPDECEGGCNSNGVPDSCDVDVTDPDGDEWVSADCNNNGEPDECEQDCNSNSVPDECDLDPSDPDGDEWVSPDCNGDLYPDECNLSLPPPLGSSDCNTNGVPDECDIAECESAPACDDCNENGIPDSCDIAAEISEDANTNGIPDECEGEGMMGSGGESMMAGEGGEESEADQSEAWAAFYEWTAGQCWGPACETTGAEQFAAMVAKLKELGLPVTGRAIEP